MDRQTAHRTIRTHQPGWWWKLLGRNRCRNCHRRWPCNRWLNAVDERDRTADQDAINAMTDYLRQLSAEARAALTTPPNNGRWWSA